MQANTVFHSGTTEPRSSRHPLPHATERSESRRIPVSALVIQETLDCYLEHCRYLRAAYVEYRLDGKPFETDFGNVQLFARARFTSVPPWYIRDTGHFNSIELNLCYNQLCYVALAQATLTGEVPWLAPHTDASDIQSRKLSDGLITSFSSRFQHAMRCDTFEGAFWVEKAFERHGRLFVRTGMAVLDQNGRTCSTAEVSTVILARAQAGG